MSVGRVRGAFTLAEMMVVLLIMTIILAAMAPVMTTRMSANKSSGGGNSSGSEIWKYVEDSGETDIYYGTTSNQRAMIGQNKAETAENARLILNTSDDVPNHLMFRNNNKTLGALRIETNNSILLGSLAENAKLSNADIAIGIESNAWSSDKTSNDQHKGAIAIGYKAKAKSWVYSSNPSISDNSPIAIGSFANATGTGSIAIGATSQALGDENSMEFGPAIAIYGTANGRGSVAINGTSSYRSLAINGLNNNTGGGSIAIGASNKTKFMGEDIATTNCQRSIAIGKAAEACGIAIGTTAKNSPNSKGDYYNHYNIAIGINAQTMASLSGAGAIAIGADAYAYDDSVAIGYNSKATNTKSVAIGQGAQATTANTIVLGTAKETVQIPGSLTVATTSYPSDKNLKNVGKEYTSSLDKIKQLKPYNFTYKNDKNKTPRVGVIAQDLKKVFPNAVQKGKDGFLTIRLEDMFYAVINAIKELDAKLVALTQTIKQVQDDTYQLKKENKELREILNQIQNDNKLLKKRLEVLESR